MFFITVPVEDSVLLVWLGERWSVDTTISIIGSAVKSSNFLLDWTVSSAIRGKSIQEVLPIAQEGGNA